jgi:hypothetical protein
MILLITVKLDKQKNSQSPDILQVRRVDFDQELFKVHVWIIVIHW